MSLANLENPDRLELDSPVHLPVLVTTLYRCNLTVLQEPGQEDLAEFLAENKV